MKARTNSCQSIRGLSVFVCFLESPRGPCWGVRRETEEERENQAEEEVLGVGEPTQTLSPQDLCQEVGAEARCGGQGATTSPVSQGQSQGRGSAGGLRAHCVSHSLH